MSRVSVQSKLLVMLLLTSILSAAGAGEYTTSIPLRSPSDGGAARATFLRWIWYAARRSGLHLDEADDDFATEERVTNVAADPRTVAALERRRTSELLPKVRITRYGADETIQFPGQVPKRMTFTVNGGYGCSPELRTGR